ncbi:hypothetical protein EV1_014596 [Malus domestica]
MIYSVKEFLEDEVYIPTDMKGEADEEGKAGLRDVMGFFMRFEEDSVESAKIVNPVECEDHLDSLSAMICLSECLPSLLRFNLLTFIFNCISRTLYLPLRL